MPPSMLMVPRTQPVLGGNTWGDVARFALECRAVLAECEADKDALRVWASE